MSWIPIDVTPARSGDYLCACEDGYCCNLQLVGLDFHPAPNNRGSGELTVIAYQALPLLPNGSKAWNAGDPPGHSLDRA